MHLYNFFSIKTLSRISRNCKWIRSQHKLATCAQGYEEAVKALNQLQCRPMLSVKEKYEGIGLNVMRQFLQRVQVSNKDMDQMRIIHVSGTKGKGSTCAFVESILGHHGVKTGFYSSPHLLEVRERIRINGKPMSHELFTKYFWDVYQLLERTKDGYTIELPSYFYFLTVMAFYVFKHERITAAIFEVGIGGEYDCTNVINHPVVCGVSSLGIDHTDVLGKSLSSIAWQKGGIFKPNVPAFTVLHSNEALKVLQQRAEERKTILNVVPDLNDYSINCGESIFPLGLSGKHQTFNASLALQLAQCWLNSSKQSPAYISPAAFHLNSTFIKGLKNCHWKGRAQILKFNLITFYIDGAHTKESLQCATEWFREESAKERMQLDKSCEKILSFNVTKGRDAYQLLSVLVSCDFDRGIFTPNLATFIPSDFNDQTNLQNSAGNKIMNVFSNRDVWLEVCASQNCAEESTDVFLCIADAMTWLTKYRDEELYKRSLALTVNFPGIGLSCNEKHIQVFVTGSLHLVGGYLRILQPDIND